MTLSFSKPRDQDMVYCEPFMREAFRLAQESLDLGEVPVGCVLVKDAQIVARGRNRPSETHNATRHAEVEAIDQFVSEFRAAHPDASAANLTHSLSECVLYVTLEPCVMCAGALRHSGIQLCFFGASNDRFGGCGSIINAHSYPYDTGLPPLECRTGYFAEEAVSLLQKFYLRENVNAPVPKRKRTAAKAPVEGETA
ncbi:hypothetical protein H696_05267 [Fonticula alba]|uniref:CMP/dCMP-type deaminase domain-containing protein n=1 Tax=Fonticula alba TaxID=691883 RepID=A0A058Z259_FONAL|nr:hypothetical protein H696_05267 [Fonticula alba]KCV68350.1 hypothetical protein H696_05267 [Fonticula alba]|eukprot:XP_009497404.1 hypothetical protein H696_05267 [Fonticula alba]